MDYAPLRMGASGPAVKQVQQMLLRLGYRIGDADGKFGVRTQRGVIAFQSAHELPVDGIVAANTWLALEKRSGGRPEPEELLRPEPAPMREIPPPPMAMPEARSLPPMSPELPMPSLPIMPLIDWTPPEAVRVFGTEQGSAPGVEVFPPAGVWMQMGQ